mmetsp:Transcript_19027/g.36618  ORF Transcript_19027/g.36618 Transcript_19027/m.36618 type:complete len:284 (-) Transcript_19027:11-862(-)
MDEFKKILDSLRAKSTEAGDGDDGPPVEIDREAAKFQELLERVRENMKAEDEARKWDEAKARYDPKDLYQILGISPREVNADRVRAAYHRRVVHAFPDHEEGQIESESCPTKKAAMERKEALFSELTIAYLVLKDDELRRIYDTHGYDGAERSENYMENSVFEQDPYEVYERFFEGEDAGDRQYLLMNADDPHAADDPNEELQIRLIYGEKPASLIVVDDDDDDDYDADDDDDDDVDVDQRGDNDNDNDGDEDEDDDDDDDDYQPKRFTQVPAVSSARVVVVV